jgi:soluble lytic murein transglycosylase-like protein
VGAALAVSLHAPLAFPSTARAQSGPAARSPASSHEILAARAAREAARSRWLTARWSGTLAALREAQVRWDRASETYRSVLGTAPLPVATPAKQIDAWASVAMDLVENGEWARGLTLLRGPLASERSLVSVHALAAGRLESPAAGLRVLGWPPDARSGSRAASARDEAQLYVAATLSDSAESRRAARAARWHLLEERRPDRARSWARYSLARSLLASGEPLLAKAILSRAPSRTNQETLLLAEITAATGDTAAAARSLIAAAARGDLATADRYASAKRAAGWVQGATLDSLSEREWMSFVRALADVGEPTLALRVLDGRRKPPPDAAAASERENARASLLYRARRYEASSAAYRALLSRPGAPSSGTRADLALGLARSIRALHDFAAADNAFVLAAAWDSAGTTGETAAWERAREWEDQRTPREAALILRWALARTRTPSLASAMRVHEAVAWIRADSLASADSTLAGPGPEDARVFFWRGWVALAAGDSSRALPSFRRAWELDPWSYEGVRARELARLPVDATQGNPNARVKHAARAALPPHSSARILDLVGFHDLSLDILRSCAMGESEARANGCVDALEAEGIYRVGHADIDRDLRLRFPPAFAGAVFRAADEDSLSPAFIWTIMRLESGYNPAARSRAGALGLLQLIVPTASRLAGRAVSEDSLLDPGLNVRLGAMYLRRLVREFGDLRPASAAYNGGEEAVRRWIAARPRVDDLWVELIPYRETREYVKQTYAAMRRYEAVYEAAPSR